jgi:hypothetical protein
MMLLQPLLLLQGAAIVAATATTIVVDPARGASAVAATAASGGTITVRDLATAAEQLAATLREQGSSDIVVELAPGAHRVPPGGLMLGPTHSPTDPAHAVVWRAAQPGVRTSVMGGLAVTGWKATVDTTLPKGVMQAPVPASWAGKRARHLYVGGARANRTRTEKSFCVLNDSLIAATAE